MVARAGATLEVVVVGNSQFAHLEKVCKRGSLGHGCEVGRLFNVSH